jgi:hypothetical protein
MAKLILTALATIIGIGFVLDYSSKARLAKMRREFDHNNKVQADSLQASLQREKDEAVLKQKRYEESEKARLLWEYQMADKAMVDQVSAEVDRFMEKQNAIAEAKLEYFRNESAEAKRLIEQGKANILELKAEQRELELRQRNRNRKQPN